LKLDLNPRPHKESQTTKPPPRPTRWTLTWGDWWQRRWGWGMRLSWRRSTEAERPTEWRGSCHRSRRSWRWQRTGSRCRPTGRRWWWLPWRYGVQHSPPWHPVEEVE